LTALQARLTRLLTVVGARAHAGLCTFNIARIRIQLPTSCPEGALFRAVAFGLMPSAP
jgi:hypothetical protein